MSEASNVTGASSRDAIVRRVIFALLLAATAALVLAHRYLPLVDWPEHLAQDAIVLHLDDPAFGVGSYYETTGWFLPYQGFRWFHIAIATVFGIGLGGRIALLTYLLGTPLAIAALLQRFGRDPWLAIASFTILVEANLLWGFAPYALATAMSLGALVLAIDYGRRGGAWRLVALTLAGIALFFTHPQQTALHIAVLGTLVIVAWRSHRIALPRTTALLVTIVPAGGLLVVYLVFAGWLTGHALADHFAIAPATVWRSPWNTVRLFPLSAGLTALGRAPWRFYLVAMFALALGAIAQCLWRRGEPVTTRPASHDAPWSFAAPTLALTWLALAFVLPAEFRGQTLGPRIASAALLGLLWLPRMHAPRTPREQRLTLAVHALVTVAAFGTIGSMHLAFARFDRSMRPLDNVIAHVPQGSRLATLVYEPRPGGWELPLYLHVGGYLVAERGGMASSGFTRTGVGYAPTVPHDALMVNELWMPSMLGWQIDLDRYGQYYDFVLVRTGGLYRGTPFSSGTSSRWAGRRVLHEGAFELWRIEAL